jgi:hypothetical protein
MILEEVASGSNEVEGVASGSNEVASGSNEVEGVGSVLDGSAEEGGMTETYPPPEDTGAGVVVVLATLEGDWLEGVVEGQSV